MPRATAAHTSLEPCNGSPLIDRLYGFKNEDISIIKNTPLADHADLQLKFELLNAFNRHQFGVPSLNPTDTLFGVPTTTLTTPRNAQLTARVRF